MKTTIPAPTHWTPIQSLPYFTCGFACIATLLPQSQHTTLRTHYATAKPLTARDKLIILARFGHHTTELPLTISPLNLPGDYILEGVNASQVPHSILLNVDPFDHDAISFDPQTGTISHTMPEGFRVTSILRIINAHKEYLSCTL